MTKQIKVMVVDDSLLTRKVLSDIINKDPDLKLVGTANDGKFALGKIAFLKPDVITLDVNMPIMDGITTLKEIMKRHNIPVIMVSAVTKEAASETIQALEIGAVDFVTKPDSTDSNINKISKVLTEKIKAAAKVKLKKVETKLLAEEPPIKHFGTPQIEIDRSKQAANKIVAIGISTGGPKALKTVFAQKQLDPSLSILIVQHMPYTFTGAFASRLNQMSNLNIKEAEDGDPILQGHVYVAPGHRHIIVNPKHGKPHIRLDDSDKVSGHKPSVDVLFQSVSKHFGSKTVGVIMTGMGRDGAEGIQLIKEKRGVTIAQDEATSVVFGMNKEAIQTGYVDKVVSLEQISDVFTIAYNKL